MYVKLEGKFRANKIPPKFRMAKFRIRPSLPAGAISCRYNK
jgi:hypothetical protein